MNRNHSEEGNNGSHQEIKSNVSLIRQLLDRNCTINKEDKIEDIKTIQPIFGCNVMNFRIYIDY